MNTYIILCFGCVLEIDNNSKIIQSRMKLIRKTLSIRLSLLAHCFHKFSSVYKALINIRLIKEYL